MTTVTALPKRIRYTKEVNSEGYKRSLKTFDSNIGECYAEVNDDILSLNIIDASDNTLIKQAGPFKSLVALRKAVKNELIDLGVEFAEGEKRNRNQGEELTNVSINNRTQSGVGIIGNEHVSIG